MDMELRYDFFVCRKASQSLEGSIDMEGLAVDNLWVESLKSFDFDVVLIALVAEGMERDFDFSLALWNEDSEHMGVKRGLLKLKSDPEKRLTFKSGVSPKGEITQDSFFSTQTYPSIIEFRGLSLPRSMVLSLNVSVEGLMF